MRDPPQVNHRIVDKYKSKRSAVAATTQAKACCRYACTVSDQHPPHDCSSPVNLPSHSMSMRRSSTYTCLSFVRTSCDEAVWSVKLKVSDTSQLNIQTFRSTACCRIREQRAAKPLGSSLECFATVTGHKLDKARPRVMGGIAFELTHLLPADHCLTAALPACDSNLVETTSEDYSGAAFAKQPACLQRCNTNHTDQL